MKALKFIINGEEQEIPQGGGDGIGRTLYVKYKSTSQKWVLNGGDTIYEIKNNVVLVFSGPSSSSIPTRIYDYGNNYIDINVNGIWNSIDSNGKLLGIVKVDNNTFQFYPRYGGIFSSSPAS